MGRYREMRRSNLNVPNFCLDNGGHLILYFLTPKAPEVATKDATGIAINGAKLNGELTNLGTATTVNVSFQWGKTSGYYSNETTPQPMNMNVSFSFVITDLTPDTTYYFRAKAVGDDTSYGDEKAFTKEKCFISTAAYGSPWQPSVKILQEFKHKYLMQYKLGRLMVDIYYRYSPSVAEVVAKNKVLKAVVRVNLLPLVAFSYKILHVGPVFTDFLLISILMASISFFIFKKRRKKRRKKE